uniref:Uncharacterized protein n=1 Tax=Leersia perrieri TaxID=77586 RepID=A0A0D9WSV8_9ORYZ
MARMSEPYWAPFRPGTSYYAPPRPAGAARGLLALIPSGYRRYRFCFFHGLRCRLRLFFRFCGLLFLLFHWFLRFLESFIFDITRNGGLPPRGLAAGDLPPRGLEAGPTTERHTTPTAKRFGGRRIPPDGMAVGPAVCAAAARHQWRSQGARATARPLGGRLALSDLKQAAQDQFAVAFLLPLLIPNFISSSRASFIKGGDDGGRAPLLLPETQQLVELKGGRSCCLVSWRQEVCDRYSH